MTRYATAFLLAATATALAPITAEARPSTKAYTCEGARNFIAARGAVVMDTKNARVYRRFVSSRSQCSAAQRTQRFYAPTKSGDCSLRICVDINVDGAGKLRLRP